MSKFIIDRDHVESGKADGRRDGVMTEAEEAAARSFRIYDGDQNLCFSGRCWFDEDREPHGWFDPLDYFGRGYGCTEIRYRIDGQWRVI